MSFKLLNIDANPKTVKGQKLGYITGVLYLAPYNVSGINVCPFADLAKCADTCLNVQGRGGIAAQRKTFVAPNGNLLPDNNIQHCRIKRTNLFHSDRELFLNTLEKEINSLIKKANRLEFVPAVRLNGTSDIRWENIKFNDGSTIFDRFPTLQFYDYTKLNNRKRLPVNYHLSWSYSEASNRFAKMRPKDLNWVVVFRNPDFPNVFLGRNVINGDEHDLRFLDPTNVVVGLKAKGSARKDTSGFVINN